MKRVTPKKMKQKKSTKKFGHKNEAEVNLKKGTSSKWRNQSLKWKPHIGLIDAEKGPSMLILLVTEDMDKKFAIFNKLGELTKHIQQIHPIPL